MGKYTYIGGDYIENIGGSKIVYVKGNNETHSNGQIIQTSEKGMSFSEPKDPPVKEIENEDKDFPLGWWSSDPEGNVPVEYDRLYNTGYRAELEDVVYFQLRVNKKVPVGTQIKFKLWDHDSSFLRFLLAPVFYVIHNDDDDDFGVEGEELFKTSKVKDVGDENFNRITIKIHLNPQWKEQLEKDKGSFKDACLDFYWTWQYQNEKWQSKDILLRVYYNRNLFIKEVYPSKYTFPEVIDSKTGDYIVFLKNEAGDVVGDINSKIDRFYAVRVTVTGKYEFEGRTNKVTKKLYEEKINLHTGKSSNKKIFEVKELVAFKAKNTAEITKIESSEVTQVKKKFSDYYNVHDIGKYGIQGLQEAMNVFGYIDLFNDASDAVAGKGLAAYDAIGLGTAAAEQATKVAIAQETKLGLMTAEEIALMSLPEWVNPVAFGLAVFEETISKPFVAQVMQDIEETMFEKMEMTKRGGFEAVRLLLDLNHNVANYYILVQGIPQNKHDEVFAGKIKTYEDLKNNNALYRSKNPNAKTYIYLLQKIKTDQTDVFDYNIDTIFI
ncbi:hypothetical protein [Flavobacterium sp.]|uniref:hypothetical protein n=1 Tax=Flavobacterium sp. TaxID=239 RepID=UPI00286E5EB8|nr:hypothetical protein [Flavobacterium sp.]